LNEINYYKYNVFFTILVTQVVLKVANRTRIKRIGRIAADKKYKSVKIRPIRFIRVLLDVSLF